MKARKNLITLRIFLLIVCVISKISSAPTTPGDSEIFSSDHQEESSTIDLCDTTELTELLICKANDGDCEKKNEERNLRRVQICASNPKCPYCEHNEEEVEPEIVPTINPPISDDDDETLNLDNESELLELVKPPTEINIDERIPANLIERNIVIENDNETHLYRGFVQPASNITTVIRLTNVIENNNIINVPTTLNNTNINNIHVYSNKSSNKGGKFGLGYTEDGPCCWSLKPASCKTTTVGLKCRHKRLRTCGSQCQKKVINSNRAQCMQIPQYPYMMCPPQQQPFVPQWNQPNFDYNDLDDDDDLPLFPEDSELDDDDSGWVVHQEKCKIVSEDGLQITNCTDLNIEFQNPYARNSMNIEASSRVTRNAKASKSKRREQPFYPNQMMFAQPMFIPVYMSPYAMPQAPMNYFMPQETPMPPNDGNIYYDDPDFERKDFHPYKNSKKHFKKIVAEHDEEEL